MATRTQSQVSASSQQIVATSAQSLLEQQNHSEFVLSTGVSGGFIGNVIEAITGRTLGTQIVGSLMPRRVPLNAPTTKYLVEGLQRSADTALQSQSEVRSRADIPTADFVRRSGFKVGSKLLIKVDPTRKSTNIAEKIPQLLLETFSLQGVAEPDEERYQLHETFESEVLFLFGRRPRIWTLQGIVANGKRSPALENPESLSAAELVDAVSKDMDFANRLLQDWEDYYRGSKAVEARARTYISYEESLIQGTLLGLTVVRNAQIPSAVNATLTFVVHQRAFIGQEVRDGITPANLADLIDKTNASGAQADKVPPSEIVEATPTPQEVSRREAVSQTQLTESQQETRELQNEKTALERSVTEQNALLSESQVEAAAATENLANAEADLATAEAFGDPVAIADANARIAVHTQELTDAVNKEDAARKALQAAQARLNEVGDEVATAVSNEEDAKTKKDTLTQTSKFVAAS